MQGWVKLHRKLLDWEWVDSPKHLALFVQLLMRANYKKTKWRGETILPGQILTGRKQLSEWSGLSERQIRTVLSDLKTTSNLTIKASNKYSIISITNWDFYQENEEERPAKRPANDQQTTTSKKDKKEKNKNILSVLDRLNSKTGNKFRPGKATSKLISNLLKDYSTDDLHHVIDVKCSQWLGTEMQMYLRPDTLFRRSKFENYLGEKKQLTPYEFLKETDEEPDLTKWGIDA